ncbi:MAG: hypothetical protein J6Q59_01025 [Paludibacteraceae bacterium]|nr:hypothetical protein [Paludibacteraceae bacterium]
MKHFLKLYMLWTTIVLCGQNAYSNDSVHDNLQKVDINLVQPTPIDDPCFDYFLESPFHFLNEPKENYKANHLHTTIDALTFARNAEYFLPYTKGYTMLGFIANPTLNYGIGHYGQITAGVHLMGAAGDDKSIMSIKPIIRLEYKPNHFVSIVGGSLYGNLNHKLYEQMYGFDRFFMENYEMGFQVLVNYKWLDADVWCNWEDFIEPGDEKQEKLTIGIRTNSRLNGNGKAVMSIPLHIVGTHRGGQFTALKDTCLETLFNAATGLELKVYMNNQKSLDFKVPVFFSVNNSDKAHIHTIHESGWGIYPNVTYSARQNRHKIEAGYWYADRYFSPKGSYLYQTRSYFDPNFRCDERSMVVAKYYYNGNDKRRLRFGADVQCYYDLKEKKLDFAFGLYLKFHENFRIAKLKKKNLESTYIN